MGNGTKKHPFYYIRTHTFFVRLTKGKRFFSHASYRNHGKGNQLQKLHRCVSDLADEEKSEPCKWGLAQCDLGVDEASVVMRPATTDLGADDASVLMRPVTTDLSVNETVTM
jgi:hypothetical protein